ncbi:MAG: amidase [Pseudomonadota bacterium]
MSASDLHQQTLADICRQIKSGALSAEAVTAATLQRIEELEPVTRAYALVLAEQALTRARELDAARQAGQAAGLLHGVPIAVKDLLDMQGQVTASGTRVMATKVARANATLVDRLLAAGAVLVGKTQLTEGAFGAHHPDIPPPRNPYDIARWPGVSSSGSGVAVAARLAYGAIGSDTGGSIRFPSASCGLVGIKPTYGRVSRHGGFPLAASLDHFGPMARSAEDAARMLTVIAGVDAADPSSLDEPVPNFAARADTPLRLGVDWHYAEQGVSSTVAANVRGVVDDLQRLGVEVVEVRLPREHRTLIEDWGLTCSVECAAVHTDYFPAQRELYGPALSALLDLGLRTAQATYDDLEELRRVFASALDGLFSSAGIDGLVMPAMPLQPQPAAVMEAGFDDSGFAPFISFTAPFNYSGHPSITLPTGLDQEGMPLSVQFIGPRLGEAGLVQLGYQVEAAYGLLPPPEL